MFIMNDLNFLQLDIFVSELSLFLSLTRSFNIYFTFVCSILILLTLSEIKNYLLKLDFLKIIESKNPPHTSLQPESGCQRFTFYILQIKEV